MLFSYFCFGSSPLVGTHRKHLRSYKVLIIVFLTFYICTYNENNMNSTIDNKGSDQAIASSQLDRFCCPFRCRKWIKNYFVYLETSWLFTEITKQEKGRWKRVNSVSNITFKGPVTGVNEIILIYRIHRATFQNVKWYWKYRFGSYPEYTGKRSLTVADHL